jgi:hypothetical protein
MLREGNRSIGLQASMIWPVNAAGPNGRKLAKAAPPLLVRHKGSSARALVPVSKAFHSANRRSRLQSDHQSTDQSARRMCSYRSAKWMLPQVFRNANIRFATSDHLTLRKTARPFSARQNNG